MAHDSFFIADPHFGHENAWKLFKGQDGVTPLRPFTSTEEMNETIVERWNKVVRPQDYGYFLGDIVIKKQFLPILERMNGHKRLVMGNHDIFDTKEYLRYFEKVRAYQVLDGYVFSHIPIHPGSMGRFKGNVHGHLHSGVVTAVNSHVVPVGEPDPRYLCVSVEHTDYAPINLEGIKSIYRARGLEKEA